MNRRTYLLRALMALSLGLPAASASAGYMQPGETMGLSLCSPLPEGVFLGDLESYGRGDHQAGAANVGVNQPVALWSTPWNIGSTHLEVFAGQPFLHIDGAVDHVGTVGFGFGPILAHDFGNGLTGGIGAFIKTGDEDQYLATQITGRTRPEADLRASMQYQTGDYTFIANAAVTTGFNQTVSSPLVQNDLFAGDFAIEKSFGKFTVGITGFGNQDINKLNTLRSASIEVGGLVSYNFGPVIVTGIVTRSVYVKGGNLGISDTLSPGYETRGWLRIIVPLIAPSKPVAVSARY